MKCRMVLGLNTFQVWRLEGEYLYLHEQNLRDVSFGKFKGDLSLAVLPCGIECVQSTFISERKPPHS